MTKAETVSPSRKRATLSISRFKWAWNVSSRPVRLPIDQMIGHRLDRVTLVDDAVERRRADGQRPDDDVLAVIERVLRRRPDDGLVAHPDLQEPLISDARQLAEQRDLRKSAHTLAVGMRLGDRQDDRFGHGIAGDTRRRGLQHRLIGGPRAWAALSQNETTAAGIGFMISRRILAPGATASSTTWICSRCAPLAINCRCTGPSNAALNSASDFPASFHNR